MTHQRRSGLALLGGAVAILLLASSTVLGSGRALDGFFAVPLLSGLTFLAAAALGDRRSALWGTGIAVTVWGALVLAHYHGYLLASGDNLSAPRDTIIYYGALLVGGVVAAVLARMLGLGGGTGGVVAAVVLSALLYAAALSGVPYAAVWWPYALIPALRGLWELRPAQRRAARVQ